MTVKEIEKQTNKIIVNVMYQYGEIEFIAKNARILKSKIELKLKDKRLSNNNIDVLLFNYRIVCHFSYIRNVKERNMLY